MNLDDVPAQAATASHHGSGGLALRITEAFMIGAFDLSRRRDAPPVGWKGMPEVAAVERLRRAGASESVVRHFLTFTAAMDRARDADALWQASAELFAEHPHVFEPAYASSCDPSELGFALRSGRVSQRHTKDLAAWRAIAESLESEVAPAVNHALTAGEGSVGELGRALQTRRRGTYAFPFLRGPKIGLVWIRMLAYPGDSRIAGLEGLPVAVDAQVRKIGEYLGVTATRGRDLSDVRQLIQSAWADDVREGGAAGPPGLENTGAALDPALWFHAKWGCTRCERTGLRMPISEMCSGCLFDSLHLIPQGAG